MAEENKFGAELSSLKIDRSRRQRDGGGWAKWWIILGVVLFLALPLFSAALVGKQRIRTAEIHVLARGITTGPVVGVVLISVTRPLAGWLKSPTRLP